MTSKLIVVAVLSGCGPSNSQVELFATVGDRGEQSAVTVIAQQAHDVQSVVALDDASATLHMRGQTIPLSYVPGELYAPISLSPPVAADEQFTIEITRDGATTMLAVSAPPAIDLTSPLPVFVPRSQDLVVSWTSASDDEMEWYLDGLDCVAGAAGNVDPGATQFVIASSQFGMKQTMEPTCGTALHMLRTRTASGASDGFESATFLYTRYLDIPFASTP